MTSPHFSVEFDERRDRLTSVFRWFMAIPHLLVISAWGSLVQTLAFIQWWIILFTGKRNSGIWNMQNSWLAYASRGYGYTYMLFDKWPAFGDKPDGEPTTYEFLVDQQVDRVSNFFRIFMLIPAVIVYLALSIVSVFALLISWFSILITGKQPRGCFEFVLKTLRYWISLNAFGLLMTDSYPNSNP
jgi:hypothetical protein